MLTKNTNKFLLSCLIFCWAVLCFKPAFAADSITCADGTCTVDSGETDNGSTYGDGNTYQNLIVEDSGVANNTTITTDGTATIKGGGRGNSFTIENGGSVTVTGIKNLPGSLTGVNSVSSGGQLILEGYGEAEEVVLDSGNLNVKDNGSVTKVTVNSGTSDISMGDSTDPSYPGPAKIQEVVVDTGATLRLYNLSPNNLSSKGVVDKVDVSGHLESNINNGDSTYTYLNAGDVTINNGGSFNLSTDDIISNLTVKYNGADKTGNIDGENATNVFVANNSSFTVKNGDSASDTEVTENGRLVVDAGGTANSVTLEGNANLTAGAGSTITNLVALGNSTVNVDNSSLAGDLVIGKNVTGFNASTLFVTGTKLNSLTLTGGQNSAFDAGIINYDNSLYNLTLEDGDYSANISKWNSVTIKNANLFAKSDLSARGISIENSSNLYILGSLASHNIVNKGYIDFVTHGSGVAGSELTISNSYTGMSGSKINLNVDMQKGVADKIIIGGSASGSTEVYLHPINDGGYRGNILFAEANSAPGGAGVFNIKRLMGSYYEWDTVFDDKKWYASLKSAIRDGKHIIVPEAAAYYGLIDNTFMQTSSLGANLRNNIALSEYAKVPCKNVKRRDLSICRGARPVFSGWFAPVSSSMTVESPYVYDTEISGFDGGLDLLSNGNTKIGLLASYRNGSYNYEDNGDEYEIIGKAETSMTSYLAGAYIRHDGQRWSSILAGYAGKIDADIETEDDISTSTSGTTYGVTLDVNYIFKNITGIRIEPGVRVSYTTVEMDPVEDDGGKTQEFDNASRTEIEAGIRFAKRWEFPNSRAEIFVKPSVVQIMSDSEDFAIDEKYSLAAPEDRTLFKVSAGLSFDMTQSLSASLAGSYATGDDYSETSGNLSVMYKF